jgi:hypothetical protein
VRVHALGDNPLAAELADLGKQSCAVAGKVVADHELIRRVLQKLGQGCLAVEQRAAAQIPAVAVEQIEGIIDQVPAMAVQRLIEQIKVRNPRSSGTEISPRCARIACSTFL